MKIINGDLLDAKEEFILHQCNCKTKYAKGLSKTMFSRYPSADVYTIKYKRVPGKIFTVTENGKTIINLFGQNYPGKPRKYETMEQRLIWF